MGTTKHPNWMVIIVFAGLAGLFLAPSIGPLARKQMALVLFSPHTLITTLGKMGVKEAPRDERPSAISYDYQMELAKALEIAQPGQNLYWRVESLRALRSHFPDRASLYANILRFATQGQVRLRRKEEFTEVEYLVREFEESPYRKADFAALAAFDADAAQGERLDPDNAYFPMMRAIGLFDAHRDEEALKAVQRAGAKSRWNDYVEDETQGHLHLAARTLLGREPLSVMRIRSSTLFPHYASLRGVARIAAYKAVEAEQHGRVQEGQAIRHSLLACGALMRDQADVPVGRLVGVAITTIAMHRPGDVVLIRHDTYSRSGQPLRSIQEIGQPRLDAYCAFLRKIGRGAEIPWIQEQYALGQAVIAKEAPQRRLPQVLPPPPQAPQLDLASWWFAGLILLLNGVGMLVWSAGVLVLRHSSRMSPKARLSVLAGVLLLMLFLASQVCWQETFLAFRQSLVGPLLTAEASPLVFSHKSLFLFLFSLPGLTQIVAIVLSCAAPITAATLLGFTLSRNRKADWASLALRHQAISLYMTYVLLALYGSVAWLTLREEVRLNPSNQIKSNFPVSPS